MTTCKRCTKKAICKGHKGGCEEWEHFRAKAPLRGCKDCHGTGKDPHPDHGPGCRCLCDTCHGAGHLLRED